MVQSGFTIGSANAPLHLRVASTVPPDGPVYISGSTRVLLVAEQPASAIELGLHTQKSLVGHGEELGTRMNHEKINELTKGKGHKIKAIGGMKTGLASLRELVYFSLVAPKALERFSIEPPKGLLLKGPSGVGKTLLVRTVSRYESILPFAMLAIHCLIVTPRHYDIPMVTVNGGELYTAYAGQTESRLRKVFDKAGKIQPSIVFIDEIVCELDPRAVDSIS